MPEHIDTSTDYLLLLLQDILPSVVVDLIMRVAALLARPDPKPFALGASRIWIINRDVFFIFFYFLFSDPKIPQC